MNIEEKKGMSRLMDTMMKAERLHVLEEIEEFIKKLKEKQV